MFFITNTPVILHVLYVSICACLRETGGESRLLENLQACVWINSQVEVNWLC